MENLFAHLIPPEDKGKVKQSTLSSLIFGDFISPDLPPEMRVYQEIFSLEDFSSVATMCLEEYNQTHKTPMNLVIFRYVLEHLSRICRVLLQPGGNGLLIGVGGSGRQSLTRLAAFMAGQRLFQPEITKNYGITDWREDLKTVLKQTGGKNIATTFLITDTQIKNERFLEDIDALLNSGEVPNLFPPEEKAEIMEAVRVAAAKATGDKNAELSPLALFAFFVSQCRAKLHIIIAFSPIGDAFRNRLRLFPSLINCCTIDWFQAVRVAAAKATGDKNAELSPLALFAFFVSQCRAKLHIIIAFSPIGDAFRNRLRLFPSLINCCTIDWFQAWPDDALARVANKFLENAEIEAEEKAAVVTVCRYFHQSTRELSEKSVS
ncbi:axonemal dynein heavy chain protein [Elysia marginata]|uniref:Axonemal dynein heavy chain protein n=1 Tax=Elysia marginata TaxID=1093978 RepID=A0AAV4FNB8_9GAST|nr:axonemal dynein heavy chain protein [Elysia marginata]